MNDEPYACSKGSVHPSPNVLANHTFNASDGNDDNSKNTEPIKLMEEYIINHLLMQLLL
ncbi:hypothetical protein CNEO3_190017 [Clostridium neonatale]|nr:hypothetical protein CNEO3_1290003 [Clostridium neonatale]CAI3580004.1 hypothetical protein CNEO4_40003 [Clostridium neonatale]CAI3609238.1 hypothetical protein CNEO3_190017 [Clostridium neonatale]CAI3619560.1 hypothetical protein CNEO3_530017 [Clostridium neonatale]CAI3626495.1 hypothetical protein CNEO4_430090 [Clostridium neonatale]